MNGSGKYVFRVLLLALVGPLAITSCSQSRATKYGRDTVMVKPIIDGSPYPYTGCGIEISPNTVLTCYHLLTNASQVNVILSDSRPDKCVQIAVNKKGDLVLMKLDHPDQHFVPILFAESLPKIGSHVAAVGIKGNTMLTMAVDVKNIVPVDYSSFMAIQMSTYIDPGIEGGALLDENGRLLGILDNKNDPDINHSLAIGTPAIKQLMDHPKFTDQIQKALRQ